jgi:hypothetical protein
MIGATEGDPAMHAHRRSRKATQAPRLRWPMRRMPSFFTLSGSLPVMPEPGRTAMPEGRRRGLLGPDGVEEDMRQRGVVSPGPWRAAESCSSSTGSDV